MAEYFAGGHLRFVNGEWRDDNGDAIDAVVVTRCNDCKHRTETGNCGHPRHHGIFPSAYPYDFCNYGERRGGGDDNVSD